MKKPEHILLAKDNEDYALLFRRALQAAQINASLDVVRMARRRLIISPALVLTRIAHSIPSRNCCSLI